MGKGGGSRAEVKGHKEQQASCSHHVGGRKPLHSDKTGRHQDLRADGRACKLSPQLGMLHSSSFSSLEPMHQDRGHWGGRWEAREEGLGGRRCWMGLAGAAGERTAGWHMGSWHQAGLTPRQGLHWGWAPPALKGCASSDSEGPHAVVPFWIYMASKM